MNYHGNNGTVILPEDIGSRMKTDKSRLIIERHDGGRDYNT